ncbi:MAG: hypothetical protein U0871_18945 [Gemmataceae bacterium]
MDLSVIPLPVVYAGLGGTLLSLIVATATNNWQPRVFFLLALRLAIGWHFLFEGLYKVQSHMVGPTDTNRPFTSEPYFAVAEGPFGEQMRKKYLVDPDKVFAEMLTLRKPVTAAEFAKLGQAEQAALCPHEPSIRIDQAVSDPPKADEPKALYARWIAGLDKKDGKVPFVTSGDVAQSVPDRLRQIALMQQHVDELAAREAVGLGNGYGLEMKRAAAARADLRAAKTDLAADAEKFLTDLIKLYAPKGYEPPAAPPKPIAELDRQTMWMLVAVGACLLAGLFTPVACLVGAGFLVLTYLTHPPFPWYPLPPGTEGNPLFINKNVIECLALLVVAVHPTGRWMGLDALWCRCLFGKNI